ncbi:DUF742 domain-containing protein [Streptomyces tremellae]|uniref:DUF742 domain-containing protein n=1 Tax=Streptomyces tremellae TaxID=1124239 RepID=A0ABP7FMU6_9ACTN
MNRHVYGAADPAGGGTGREPPADPGLPGDGDPDGEDDGAGTMVRPYTITAGRTAPEYADLTLITVLATVPDPRGGAVEPAGLQPEHRLILQRCRHATALAEVSAALGLPVSVTKVLAGDLVAAGLLLARPPLTVAGAGHLGLLAAVRDGLRRL